MYLRIVGAQFFNFVIDIYNINNYCLKSISLDGKLRLWNIPEKKVALWNEVETGNNSRLITAVNFIQVSNKISHYKTLILSKINS